MTEEKEKDVPLYEGLRNSVQIGDMILYSNEIGFAELIAYAKTILKDKTLKEYLTFKKVQKKISNSYVGE